MSYLLDPMRRRPVGSPSGRDQSVSSVGDTDATGTAAAAPSLVSPPTSPAATPAFFTPEFAPLRRLLGAPPGLSQLLASVGISTLEDVAYLSAGPACRDEVKNSTLSPIIKDKLLAVADFLAGGGSLEDASSMKDIMHWLNGGDLPRQHEGRAPAREDADRDPIVDLNVGGHKFTTSRQTLCRVPNSYLEAMFSGRHPNSAPRQGCGEYFIDRDGSHFQHALNFLRVGAVVSLPPDGAGRDALAVEADFYGLTELVRAIRAPQVDVAECLSEQTLTIRRNEEELRRAYMHATTATEAALDPHRGLLPLFCPDHGVESLPLTYQPDGPDGPDGPDAAGRHYLCMGKLRKRAAPGIPTTAATLDEFRSNFNREHPNVLHRLSDVLLEERVIVAGGAVLRALTSSGGCRTASWWGKKSDVDMFVYGVGPEEANRVAMRIFYALAVDNEQWVVMRSRGVITMHNWREAVVDQKVQIVLRIYDSPAEVLLGFDVDCCCCAYDGRSVWVTPRCVNALRTGVSILNPLHAWPNKASYELRLAKYAIRGFAVVIPGFDRKRIDSDRIHRSKLAELKGLARLLKVSGEMDSMLGQFDSPLSPQDIKALSSDVKQDLSPDEFLIGGFSGYDDGPGAVIVPAVYCDGNPYGFEWYYDLGGSLFEFPIAMECRNAVWAEIVDAAVRVPDGVPPLLIDSWDLEKRSREYLNATMDKFDLDNLYYAHAYEAEE